MSKYKELWMQKTIIEELGLTLEKASKEDTIVIDNFTPNDGNLFAQKQYEKYLSLNSNTKNNYDITIDSENNRVFIKKIN